MSDAAQAFEGAMAEYAKARGLFAGALTATKKTLIIARMQAAARQMAAAYHAVAKAAVEPDPIPPKEPPPALPPGGASLEAARRERRSRPTCQDH